MLNSQDVSATGSIQAGPTYAGSSTVPNAAVEELIERLTSAADRTPALIDWYYTLCIPYYREFLGDHWHTGYYAPVGPIGLKDQLRMELCVAASADFALARDVLDVGCGIGGPACYLATLTPSHVRGLTPNAIQLDLARARARHRKLHNRVKFDQGTADKLPYLDESFDVVLFFESPCHFADRERFFREVYRVLRPGGRLAGEDWLAAEGLSQLEADRYIRPVCETWAIPELGTRTGYAAAMIAAGLRVREAIDMHHEMALLRGFVVETCDQIELAREIVLTADPIRRFILSGLFRLGEAAAAGAFTIGRFLAVKEPVLP